MRSGFTLIELLLVVAIVGILTATITLNGLGYRNRQLLDTTTQQIAASIRDAQNRSMSQQNGLAWGIYFNNSTTDSYTVFGGASYAVSASSTWVLTTLDAPLEFTSPTSGNIVEVNFAQVSGLPNTSAFVTITNGIASSTITIASNGQVTY